MPIRNPSQDIHPFFRLSLHRDRENSRMEPQVRQFQVKENWQSMLHDIGICDDK